MRSEPPDRQRRHPVARITPEDIVRAGDSYLRCRFRFRVALAVALWLVLAGLVYELFRASGR